MKNYSNWREDAQQVQVPGFGVMGREQAREQAIGKLQDIVRALTEGRNVPLDSFDLAKAFYEAYAKSADSSLGQGDAAV